MILQCKLPHFDRSQVGEYIKQHLKYAGADHEIFSDTALDVIFRYSSGAARLINKVCTHCLLYGAHGGFYPTLDQVIVEDCFRQAIQKYGVPEAVYFDKYQLLLLQYTQ